MLLMSTFLPLSLFIFFFFNDTSTTEIYTLSLHDALPISIQHTRVCVIENRRLDATLEQGFGLAHEVLVERNPARSEEHTSELQSHSDLVCRLLLEKKKNKKTLIKCT